VNRAIGRKLIPNYQLFVIPRIDLHILVAVGVHNHPGPAEGVVERVVRVAVNPDIRARVGDFVGKIGNESGIEAVSGSYNSYWYNKKRPRGRYRKAFFLWSLSGARDGIALAL